MATPTTTIPRTTMMARPMPPFLEDSLLGAPGKLALFGKHPAAADHLEDMGLSTSSLVAFKQAFYLEGITECLNRQTWLKDLPAADAPPYDHCLLSLGRKGWMAVRFQQSSDAAGRKQFPLVLALHGSDFSSLNRIADIGQLLETALTAAAGARDLAALRQVHNQAQAQVLELLSTPAASPPGPSAREAWLQGLPLGQEKEGLWRICHALSPAGASAGSARVPLHLGGPWQSATLWQSLVKHLFQPPAGTTVVWRPRQAFADLALCPPHFRILGSLFAPESSQPQTCTVPFNYTPELKAEAQGILIRWFSESSLFEPLKNTQESPSLLNKVCNGLRSWFKP
ncbi:hypothetical protein WJU23_14015 [Prosthecobacter sp. SYSU 5D2]|uniref:hypothetical protein n=1 Tax=Prosthecobacter sp. SYSU 5D2 TaxID=3134134 RepID=UPI0031FEDCED